ncbi:MAG: lamin tail domain-containing protein, partial [Planctomycetales bacterium]|nr:lamin tail domain-containing protein [Planctomycetales bacterium]
RDAIELFNASQSTVDLSGWFLSDSPDNFRKYQIPAGTQLVAGQSLVIDGSAFNPDTPIGGNVSFGLSSGGDELWLTTGGAAGQVVSIEDHVAFGGSREGETWGRTDATNRLLVPLATASLGQLNAQPRVPGVVISEVQYHPVANADALMHAPLLDVSDLEFIELFNPTSAAIELSDWKLSGGVEYDFPMGTVLNPTQRLLVLKFNPNNRENDLRTTAFVANYRIDPTQPMVGGYRGSLDNSDDVVTLWRKEAGETPIWVWEDEVVYDDLAPWPAADGTGASLNRTANNAFGSAAASWAAAAPSPGHLPAVRGGDFNGDNSVDTTDINLLFQQMQSGQFEAAYDLDADGLVGARDRDLLITSIIGTTFGDVNLDGQFDSTDLIQMTQAGQYEDGVAANSAWESGDLDGDGDFTSRDLVLAFQRGVYRTNDAPAAVAAVDHLFADAASDDDEKNSREDSLTANYNGVGDIEPNDLLAKACSVVGSDATTRRRALSDNEN